MGIKGLLPIVKPIIVRKHISKYSNSVFGIDGHAWLHQIIPNIAYEIFNDIKTDSHLKILLGKLKNLMNYNIRPVVVFDGDYMLVKEKTINERKALREKYIAEVKYYLERGDKEKAKDLMKRCVTITKEVFLSVLKALQVNGIEYIISPYEADAQLLFLQKIKYIDHIITEDSDLIPYGAKSVLYKFSGTHVEEYSSSKLSQCKDNFFAENILDICILSGCDYLDSIKGVGLITAHAKLKESGDVSKFIELMILAKKHVPEDYLDEFMKAKLAFLHHIVYHPHHNARQYLNSTYDELGFLGTLENLPFVVETTVGETIRMERHFKPIKTVSQSNSLKENKENINDDSVEVDEHLVSPYFK